MKKLQAGALLLAAGKSERMGQPKALLSHGGRSFYGEVVDAVAGLRFAGSAAVVAPSLKEKLAGEAGFQELVENTEPERGQLYSLCLGLAALEQQNDALDGAIIFLIDNPGALEDRTRALLAAAAKQCDNVYTAAYRGEPGHPLWLPVRLWQPVRSYTGPEGLRGFFRSEGEEPQLVETTSRAALHDIDTPGDYERLQQNGDDQNPAEDTGEDLQRAREAFAERQRLKLGLSAEERLEAWRDYLAEFEHTGYQVDHVRETLAWLEEEVEQERRAAEEPDVYTLAEEDAAPSEGKGPGGTRRFLLLAAVAMMLMAAGWFLWSRQRPGSEDLSVTEMVQRDFGDLRVWVLGDAEGPSAGAMEERSEPVFEMESPTPSPTPEPDS